MQGMKKPMMHSIWLVLVLSVLGSSVRAGTLGNLTYYQIADLDLETFLPIPTGQVMLSHCDKAAKGELVIPN